MQSCGRAWLDCCIAYIRYWLIIHLNLIYLNIGKDLPLCRNFRILMVLFENINRKIRDGLFGGKKGELYLSHEKHIRVYVAPVVLDLKKMRMKICTRFGFKWFRHILLTFSSSCNKTFGGTHIKLILLFTERIKKLFLAISAKKDEDDMGIMSFGANSNNSYLEFHSFQVKLLSHLIFCCLVLPHFPLNLLDVSKAPAQVSCQIWL